MILSFCVHLLGEKDFELNNKALLLAQWYDQRILSNYRPTSKSRKIVFLYMEIIILTYLLFILCTMQNKNNLLLLKVRHTCYNSVY